MHQRFNLPCWQNAARVDRDDKLQLLNMLEWSPESLRNKNIERAKAIVTSQTLFRNGSVSEPSSAPGKPDTLYNIPVLKYVNYIYQNKNY